MQGNFWTKPQVGKLRAGCKSERAGVHPFLKNLQVEFTAKTVNIMIFIINLYTYKKRV